MPSEIALQDCMIYSQAANVEFAYIAIFDAEALAHLPVITISNSAFPQTTESFRRYSGMKAGDFPMLQGSQTVESLIHG
jgi:hypothetical protein